VFALPALLVVVLLPLVAAAVVALAAVEPARQRAANRVRDSYHRGGSHAGFREK
jgi:hypothetical protein